MKIIRIDHLMKTIKKFITKLLIRLSGNAYIHFDKVNNSEVTFVVGMFRSGTSLTCQLLHSLGLNLGPRWRLLKSKGHLKDLNPDGFFEDFLFVQLPLYWCFLLDKSGENPPNEKEVETFDLEAIRIRDFIAYSEYKSKDERLSFFYRHVAYFLLILRKEKVFVFKKKRVVKSPMLTPFHLQLKKWFPKSYFLIVIRNPESTIQSSLALTHKADIELYNSYYIHLLNLYVTSKKKCVIFSYDNLLSFPEDSVKAISNYYGLPVHFKVIHLIKRDLIRNKQKHLLKSNYYELLYEDCINKLVVL